MNNKISSSALTKNMDGCGPKDPSLAIAKSAFVS